MLLAARFLKFVLVLLLTKTPGGVNLALQEFNRSPELALSARCQFTAYSKSVPDSQPQEINNESPTPLSMDCALAHYANFEYLSQSMKRLSPELYIATELWIADANFSGCNESHYHQTKAFMLKSEQLISLLLPRGKCSFASKAEIAQQQGFKALIIENSEDGPPIPPDVTSSPLLDIPVLMVSTAAGTLLRSNNERYQRIGFNIELSSENGTDASKGVHISRSSGTTRKLRVVTAVPRGLSITVVRSLVQAITETQPFAELLIFLEHDPVHAKWILQLGARITLVRLPGPTELPACSLAGALHAECVVTLMELTKSSDTSLWLHPSFESSRVPDVLLVFESVSAQIDDLDSSSDVDSFTAVQESALLMYEGVPLASEGMHWSCNGALAFREKVRGNGKSKALEYRFILPWNLCTIHCEDQKVGAHKEIFRFSPRNESRADISTCNLDKDVQLSEPIDIDVVIPAHIKDKHTLNYTVIGARRYVVGVRRVIVVSRTRLTQDAEFFSEEEFAPLISIKHIEYILGRRGIYQNNSMTPFGWYFQQLIKFYAPLLIPGISDNVLVLDSDTVFFRAAYFIEPESILEGRPKTSKPFIPSTIFTVTGDKSEPQMNHMTRLLPDLRRQHGSMSAIAHHMLFNKHILLQMMKESETAHRGLESTIPFYDIVLQEIDPEAEHKKSVSEYEIYFNYFFKNYAPLTRVRHSSWCNGLSLHMTEKYNAALSYDFVSFHDTFRARGCAAFCCCQHLESNEYEAKEKA